VPDLTEGNGADERGLERAPANVDGKRLQLDSERFEIWLSAGPGGSAKGALDEFAHPTLRALQRWGRLDTEGTGDLPERQASQSFGASEQLLLRLRRRAAFESRHVTPFYQGARPDSALFSAVRPDVAVASDRT
jgi:hypothetical protein